MVSNLDDSRSQIEKRAERFYAHYERLKTMKGKAQTVLQEFDSVVDTLHKVCFTFRCLPGGIGWRSLMLVSSTPACQVQGCGTAAFRFKVMLILFGSGRTMITKAAQCCN